MTNYNLTILINNKVDEKGRTGVIDGVKKDFGNLIKEDLWGVRTLAYEIKHMDKAFFAYFEFESEPQSVITLDKNIRLNEDIIRYLLVKTKKAKRVTVARAKRTAVREAAKGQSGKETEKVEASVKAEKEPVEEVKKVKRVVKINTKKSKGKE